MARVMDETLFPYQVLGAYWLRDKSVALLADDMGLGKSAQAITAADISHALRVMVICPAVARINWEREFRKFSLLERDFVRFQTRSQKPVRKQSVILSYDLATTFSAESFGNFDVLILDECHYLKSTEAKRTSKILGKEGYVRYAKKIWALSGTPAPNHAGELWPILYTFGSVSESYDDFINRYCTIRDTTYGRQITGTKQSAIPELRKILSDIMLRRKTIDVLKELPPIVYRNMAVEPGPVELEMCSSLIQFVFPEDRRDEFQKQIQAETKLVNDLTNKTGFTVDGMKILEGLATSISTLRKYIGLQKVRPTIDLVLEELNANAYDKIVIFAIHRDVIEQLRVGLTKFNAVTLYGGTDPDKRQKNIDKFQTNPRCRVFIGNIQACGTAVNLTAASQVMFVEQDWVPGNNLQAAKRCHRIGQTKPVFVRILGIADSFDERIASVLARKMREISEIFL